MYLLYTLLKQANKQINKHTNKYIEENQNFNMKILVVIALSACNVFQTCTSIFGGEHDWHCEGGKGKIIPFNVVWNLAIKGLISCIWATNFCTTYRLSYWLVYYIWSENYLNMQCSFCGLSCHKEKLAWCTRPWLSNSFGWASSVCSLVEKESVYLKLWTVNFYPAFF